MQYDKVDIEGRNRHTTALRGGGTRGAGASAPPISGLGALPLQYWTMIEENSLKFSCFQVEILVYGVAVDSIDTHCRDYLCACCSGYFCHS